MQARSRGRQTTLASRHVREIRPGSCNGLLPEVLPASVDKSDARLAFYS